MRKDIVFDQEYEGIMYAFKLSNVSGAANNENWHLSSNNFYQGRLWNTERGWHNDVKYPFKELIPLFLEKITGKKYNRQDVGYAIEKLSPRIALLLTKYLQRTSTPEEHDELDTLVDASDDNSIVFEEVTEKKYQREMLYSLFQIHKQDPIYQV